MGRRGGFTLIELLVVIAIIAILASILFPVFTSAKKRGQQSKCLNNLKQLSTALRQYCDDYDGFVPLISHYNFPRKKNWCGSRGTNDRVVLQEGSLWRYVKNTAVYLCPSDLGRDPEGLDIKNATNDDFPLSYSMNGELNPAELDPRRPLSLDNLVSPSKVLLFIHEDRKTINDGLYLWYNNALDQPDPIHYDGTTCSYCDGHVKWISVKELTRVRKMRPSPWDPLARK